MLEHDTVYKAKLSDKEIIGETDLAAILFDTDHSVGSNGIWAIANVATSKRQAIRMAQELLRGGLPNGISDHNDYTRQWRRAQRANQRHDIGHGSFAVDYIAELEKLSEAGDSQAQAELEELDRPEPKPFRWKNTKNTWKGNV